MKHCKASGQDRNEARYVEGGRTMSTQSSNGRPILESRTDVVIITLYAVEVEVEKIGGGKLTAPNCACQLGSGFEMDRVDLLGRLVMVFFTAKESTNENRECAWLKNLLENCHGRYGT